MTLDLTDQKFGMLTAKRPAGHLGPMIAWECECECGGKKRMRGPHLVYRGKFLPHTLHCGCRKPTGITQLAEYRIWSRRLELLCDEWLDFKAFQEQCYIHRRGRRFLVRIDETRPLGPDNFQWTNQRAKILKKCIEALVASGMSQTAATSRAKRVSRQRQSQIVWKSQGLCTICRQPRTHYSQMCDECLIRQKNIQTPYWLRPPKKIKPPRKSADWRSCPWDLWFNGQVHRIDAQTLPGMEFRASACVYAARRGLKLSIKSTGTTYILQARKKKRK